MQACIQIQHIYLYLYLQFKTDPNLSSIIKQLMVLKSYILDLAI